MALVSGLVATPIPGLLPLDDARGALRVLIASLSPGGAERIVLEWLGAEAARGRAIELAVLHARRNALAAPSRVRVRTRQGEEPRAYLERLAEEWGRESVPVSTHLITDDLLRILWRHGVRTVPVVHNTRAGWRNDPALWSRRDVPLAVACAQQVAEEMRAAGCRVPIVVLRHRPDVGSAAFDLAVREAMRTELGIRPGTFLVGAVGALKPQKDYPQAVEVLARLCERRDCALVIVGGALGAEGLGELDRVVQRALECSVAERLRLPGFAPRIEPYLAACDALLNVSRFEGLSMATQEALAAGLPVVATHVGGQSEIEEPALELVARDAPPAEIALRLSRHPVRVALVRRPRVRATRAWSLAHARRPRGEAATETLFVTANLNAGGAQRSLVNLAGAIARRHRLAVAVCGDSTQSHFANALRDAGVAAFRPAADADAFAVGESILAAADARGARNLCFWNVDPRVKLLTVKFAPAGLRLLDVSPGAYAFEELEAQSPFAEAAAYSVQDYYRRLDVLVLKFRAAAHPPCARVEVIPNAVAWREVSATLAPRVARFLVSGRIAPSKRLETVIDAFTRVQARHPGAELHIVGTVEERHREYAEHLARSAAGLPIRFRGADPGLGHLGEAFTSAVVLGTHQGSPNAVLEAMAAGIPVIANASGGTGDILDGGAAGWLLAEDADSAAVAAAMDEIAANPQAARARARHALTRVRAEHAIETMAARYLALLGEGVASRHEKMAAWISASAPAAPPDLSSASSSLTAAG